MESFTPLSVVDQLVVHLLGRRDRGFFRLAGRFRPELLLQLAALLVDRQTIGFSKKQGKPCLHISRACYQPAIEIQKFVKEHDIRVLNVAGSRESKEPGIYQWMKRVLADAVFRSMDRPS